MRCPVARPIALFIQARSPRPYGHVAGGAATNVGCHGVLS